MKGLFQLCLLSLVLALVAAEQMDISGIFGILDKDGNEVLDKGEMYSNPLPEGYEKAAESNWALMDTDNSDTIDQDELAAFMSAHSSRSIL